MKLLKHLAVLGFIFAAAAFSGCNTEDSGSTPVPDSATYSVTVADDIENGTVSVSKASAKEGETITLTATAHEGYHFDTFTVTKGDETVTVTKGDEPVTVKEFTFVMSAVNVTVNATFAPNTYTVTLFNGNGTTSTITATYDEVLPDLESLPVATGSDSFGGYYTQQYAKGTKFIGADGKGCTAWNIAEDTTLYVAWGYKITYENTTGAQNPNPEVYTGEKDVIFIEASKDYYTFEGWFDSETGGNKVEKIEKESIGAKTVYAHWTPITYTITYNLDGGTFVSEDYATSYTIESEIMLPIATKEGDYTFKGWKNADDESEMEVIPQGTAGNMSLTAIWVHSEIAVTIEFTQNPEITIEQVEDYNTITLVAANGFSGYTWRIDGVLASSFEGATVSEDGAVLSIQKIKLMQRKFYQVSLFAMKRNTTNNTDVVCGTQISITAIKE